uniref:laforin-like n=1 Tax=Arvicanthis niloticus TaxID=61156 RepID=UPI001486EF4D|nr:laforin-like [Arvicanthis niloticus]
METPPPEAPPPRRPRPVRCAAGRRRLEPGASSANGGRGIRARGTQLTGCAEVSAGREKEGQQRPRMAQEVPLSHCGDPRRAQRPRAETRVAGHALGRGRAGHGPRGESGRDRGRLARLPWKPASARGLERPGGAAPEGRVGAGCVAPWISRGDPGSVTCGRGTFPGLSLPGSALEVQSNLEHLERAQGGSPALSHQDGGDTPAYTRPASCLLPTRVPARGIVSLAISVSFPASPPTSAAPETDAELELRGTQRDLASVPGEPWDGGLTGCRPARPSLCRLSSVWLI